jgi:hypothetical protein
MTSQPSERIAVVGTVDPQTVANTEQLTDAVDMSKWHEAMFVLLLGNMAAETIDFKLMESDTAGGTYTDISGKAITQLAAHATNNDNKQAVINLKAEELGTGKRYVKARVITGGATGGPAAVLALGVRPRFGPASDDDSADVVQIVT